MKKKKSGFFYIGGTLSVRLRASLTGILSISKCSVSLKVMIKRQARRKE